MRKALPRSLHVVGSLRPSSGGPTESVPRLCRALRELGAQADVATVRGKGEPFSDQPGLEVHAFPLNGSPRFRKSPALADFLERAASRYDILHVHGLWQWPGMAARKAAVRHDRPLVISPRGMLDPWALSQNRWAKRIALVTWEGSNLRECALFHATSAPEAEQILRRRQDARVSIIPNGVDLPPESTLGAPRARQLLFLARFHPKKGGDLLLRAWSKITSQHPGWSLRMVGPDEDGFGSDWRSLARALQLPQDSVTFEAPVAGKEKSALLATASILVLPSRGENFGNVIAEALAHATPVVTTTATPWSGLANHACGWITDPDPEDLAAVLQEAISTSPRDLHEMGTRGRTWMAKEHSWPAVAQALLDAYCALIPAAHQDLERFNMEERDGFR